jgi:hypothetical protein
MLHNELVRICMIQLNNELNRFVEEDEFIKKIIATRRTFRPIT